MNMNTFRFAVAVIANALVALPFAAVAAEENVALTETDTLVAMTSSPVNDEILSESRGAFIPDLTNLDVIAQTANSSNNVNVGGVTGNNNINGGSFTNTQGLVNVIQNSGNNVVIQSSTIVNMTMINH